MPQHIMKIGDREFKAEVKELTSEKALVSVDGVDYTVQLSQLGKKKLQVPDLIRPVVAAAAPVPLVPTPPRRQAPAAAGDGTLTAPMPGSIFQMKVREGDTVQAGQVVLVMEAMKMENPMNAPFTGTVTKVFVREGDNVGEGDPLVEIARPQMTTL